MTFLNGDWECPAAVGVGGGGDEEEAIVTGTSALHTYVRSPTRVVKDVMSYLYTYVMMTYAIVTW